MSIGLGDEVGLVESIGEGAVVGGGGSIAELLIECLEESTASGRGAMASSEDEVSIVKLTVVLGVGRRV